MRVNQVDGFLLQQLENPVSDEPDNRGFAQDRLAPRNGPFGKLAAKRCPAVGDIFHDGFRGVRIISVLERTCQGLRTETEPVLRGDEMKAADAITRMHGPRVIEHMKDTIRHMFGQRRILKRGRAEFRTRRQEILASNLVTRVHALFCRTTTRLLRRFRKKENRRKRIQSSSNKTTGPSIIDWADDSTRCNSITFNPAI